MWSQRILIYQNVLTVWYLFLKAADNLSDKIFDKITIFTFYCFDRKFCEIEVKVPEKSEETKFHKTKFMSFKMEPEQWKFHISVVIWHSLLICANNK